MSSKIKFIYFDVGGVLLDWYGAFYSVAKQFNKERRQFIRILCTISDDITKGFLTPQKFWELCKKELKIKNENFDLLDSWTNDYFPIKKTHQLIKKLSKKYQIGLLSNIYTGSKKHLLEKDLIPKINYSQIIFSCDIGSQKPENKIYKVAQKKSKVRPNEILFIDDRKENFPPAKKLGWNCYWFNFRNPEKSIRELERKLL